MEKIKNRYKENKIIFLKWIIAVIPLVFLILIFRKIPDKIPVQFGENGEILKKASKYSFQMILQSSLGIIAAIIFSIIMKFIVNLNFSPRQNHYLKALKTMNIINIIITTIFSIFSIMILLNYI